MKSKAVDRLRWRPALLGACALFSACQLPAKTSPLEPAALTVIPAAARVEPHGGAFRLTAQTRIAPGSSADGPWIAHYLADLVERRHGWSLPIDVPSDSRTAAPGIAFAIDPALAASPEAYRLEVGPAGVMVSAGDDRGLFYGVVTLGQLLMAGAGDGDGTAVSLPALRIRDEPRFGWRGLMLDSARHYQSPEFIERFIDWMALHKLNVLHWHLTDDQAWRLEIRKYPRLTQVGAWRVPAGAAAADLDPATGKPRLYGGYYSQDTVRRIVRYAAERMVTIVPEIEMPGHATAAIVAYPRLGVDGRAPTAVPADWGIYPNLFNIEDATFEFIEDVLREVLELFPGEYVHVGGDEVVKEPWQTSPRIQQLMRERGIADEHALQSYFIQRVGRFLSAQGRRMIGWDEILEGGLAQDSTVMSWRGVDGALAAAMAGHDAVLSPWPTLYFDNRQGAGATEPPGRGRVISLENVYRFNPMPAALQPTERHHVLGVEATLWTEHIRTEERVQWMAWPRAAAIAEVGWSPPERLDFDDFRTRVGAALGWYRALGLGYADTEYRAPAMPQERRRVSQELKSCTDKLVLNLEDDAPVRGERAVFLVDIMAPCWIFEGADLARIRSITATVGQFPFNFQIGKDRDSIHLRPPQGPDGELEVRVDGCEGERIAVLPLGPAADNAAVTRLPAASIAPRTGRHNLCFTFTGRNIDPMWAIDSVELLE